MAKQKYYYAIVKKDNAAFLLEDGKLPIYLNKSVARERVVLFPKHCLVRLPITDFEKLILKNP